jgi:hypothetical protein
MGAYLGAFAMNVAKGNLPAGALGWQAAAKPARYTAQVASPTMGETKKQNLEAT